MPEKIKKTNIPLLLDLFNFLKLPKEQDKVEKLSAWQKLCRIVRLLAFQILVIYILSIVIYQLMSIYNYDGENLIGDLLDEIWLFFILACIQAPLLEETIFRIWLRPTRFNLSISITFITFFLINLFLPSITTNGFWESTKNWFNSLEWYETIPFTLAITILIFVINYWVIFRNKNRIISTKKFISKKFKFLFYAQAILFGIAHITNNTELKSIWFLVPLFAMPQFIAGLGLGYVRTKFGALWSIIMHAINNSIPFLIFFIISFLSEPVKNAYFDGQTDNLNNTSNTDYLTILILFLIMGLGTIIGITLNIYNLVDIIRYKNKKNL